MKKTINIQINQDILKIIAILTMTVDHIGYILTPTFEEPLRLIGRLSFPIFVFLLIFNLIQKVSFQKYITRLFSFAIITSLMIGPFKYILKEILPLNIFWTLLLGITAIYGLNKINQECKSRNYRYFITIYMLLICITLSILTDYAIFGFLYILSFYRWYTTKNIFYAFTSATLGFLINLDISLIACVISCLTTVVFLFHITKSKNAKRFLKPWWLFYAYYPIHLSILYAIKLYN
jgi:hypothetical protein